MVTKLWLVPSNISLPSQGSCLQSTVRQGLRSIWDNAGTFTYNTATTAKSLQSCLTLCDPMDGSPPGSPVPGILQARTLEWVAISFSNAWKWKVKSESEVAQSCPTLSDPMFSLNYVGELLCYSYVFIYQLVFSFYIRIYKSSSILKLSRLEI